MWKSEWERKDWAKCWNMFAQFKFYIWVEIKNSKVNHGVESIVVHLMKISHKIGDNGWLNDIHIQIHKRTHI